MPSDLFTGIIGTFKGTHRLCIIRYVRLPGFRAHTRAGEELHQLYEIVALLVSQG